MKRCLPFLIVLISLPTVVFGGEFFGFQTLNILNLKDNTKCSAVLLNTENGCQAVTNAHCAKGLAIGEENLIILATQKTQIDSDLGAKVHQQIMHSSETSRRSYLIKAKPSSDLAQIHFDPAWAPEFCNDSFRLNSNNTKRHLHIDEVYTQQQQNEPGQVNQHIPGNSTSPNPTIYYRPSQNFLLMASGFQNDAATLLSIFPVTFDSFSGLSESMKSRLNVEYSSLPGIDFLYQVAGINLSQGMSGGALFEVENKDSLKINFKGLSSSFYPFQWKSNFIPASYILEFINAFNDDHTDHYEISINSKVQVASDRLSAKEEQRIKRLEEEGEVPNLIVFKRPRFQLREPKAPVRIPRSRVNFGDTDQDDVGGDVSLACDPIASDVDPFFDIVPPVTNCFDLSQTRFQHSGVMAKEHAKDILIGYEDTQINGLADLRALKNRKDFDSTKLIKRPIGDYPEVELRKSILKDFKGIYFERENAAVFNQAMHYFAHLGESFTRQYSITPSSNALIRESVINETELYGDLFQNLFNYDIANDITKTHHVKLKLNIDEQKINLGIKLTNDQNYSFSMTPIFDESFKKLTLKTTLTIYDQQFNKLSTQEFKLQCDNRSVLKLICFNEKMEFGLSKARKDSSTLSVRVAFWEGFKTKQEALADKNLKMIFNFGELERSESIVRNLDFDLNFNRVKLKNLLKEQSFVEIDSAEILSYVSMFPRSVAKELEGELQTKSFFKGEKLLHLVFTKNKKFGVLYDRSFKVVGVILKGKVSTSPYDIF